MCIDYRVELSKLDATEYVQARNWTTIAITITVVMVSMMTAALMHLLRHLVANSFRDSYMIWMVSLISDDSSYQNSRRQIVSDWRRCIRC